MSVNKRIRKLQDGNVSVRYVATIPIRGGRPFSKVFSRKVDAEAWERETRILSLSNGAEVRKNPTTVAEFSVRWLKEFASTRLQDSTLFRYQKYLDVHILPRLGNRSLDQLTRQEIERWLGEMRKSGIGPKTANDCLSFLHRLVRHAVAWQLLKVDPLQGIRLLARQKPEMMFWTKEEASRFLDEALVSAPEVYSIFLAALSTGMRLGEIAALQWDSVNLDEGMITVRRTFCLLTKQVKETTKTHSIRIVPINDQLGATLLELVGENRQGFVFPRTDFGKLHRRIGPIAKRAKVKTIRFHDLRHTFASLWMMAGKSIYDLQKVLGHQSVQMTERYSHLAPGHLRGSTAFLAFGQPAEAIRVQLPDVT